MDEKEIKWHREVNLKGEVCPYTFVKSKLVLEEMKVGEVLRVIVDYEPAIYNVSRSMENHGHKVLDISKISNTDWHIVIKKSVR